MQSKSITTFEFQHNIWQVHAHPQEPILLIETRNADTRTASFQAVNMPRHEILWTTLDMGDDWWRGLEMMTDKYLVLHGFEDANNPISSGIYVFELFTGKKVYANDKSIFISLEADHLVEKIVSGEEEIYYSVNLKDGKQTLTDAPENGLSIDYSLLKTPQWIEEGEPNFSKIAAFIHQYHSPLNILSIEYLETHECISVAWIEPVEQAFHQYVMVVDKEGNVLIKELVADNLKGKSPGAFLVAHGFIAFVKQQTSLWYYQC